MFRQKLYLSGHVQPCPSIILSLGVGLFLVCVHTSCDLFVLQYLAKTHNCWHRVGLLLEQRAQENGELEYHVKEPPAYDGIYSDQLLDVPQHVSPV